MPQDARRVSDNQRRFLETTVDAVQCRLGRQHDERVEHEPEHDDCRREAIGPGRRYVGAREPRQHPAASREISPGQGDHVRRKEDRRTQGEPQGRFALEIRPGKRQPSRRSNHRGEERGPHPEHGRIRQQLPLTRVERQRRVGIARRSGQHRHHRQHARHPERRHRDAHHDGATGAPSPHLESRVELRDRGCRPSGWSHPRHAAPHW